MTSNDYWKELSNIYLNKNSGFVNMGWAASSLHRGSSIYNKTALIFINRKWPGDHEGYYKYSFHDLDKHSHLFSFALQRLGLKAGDILFSLSPRLPEFYVSCLGTLKRGLIFAPLFPAFGIEPIQTRIQKANGCALFTTVSLFQKKIAPIQKDLPSLKYVILVDDNGEIKSIPGAIDFYEFLDEAEANLHFEWHLQDQGYWWSDHFIEKTISTTPALLHFTSGTTGQPKGALHSHGAALFHQLTGTVALDLRPNDLFWCTADPGWVTGMSYGVLSPLLNGVTSVIDESDFVAERWYKILQEFKITNWYTAPTALRLLMKQGDDLAKSFSLRNLRFVASVGEPLNPEVIYWGRRVLDIEIHDNWWQTETGGIMIANLPSTKIKPGSMGKPIPGIEVRLIERKPNGGIKFVETPHQCGEIALKVGWPAMFQSYLNDEERYRRCFCNDWYLSGDLAKIDEDGYFWFIGRSDDVIKSSGHLIGPFEVESAIMEHPLVAEAAVIGIPDSVAGEVVKAFVSLKKSITPSEELASEILGLARKKLGPALAPRELKLIDAIPKTRSGKIMRRLLRARELGLPEGDVSTMQV